MDCKICGLRLASTRQIESGKLLYACDHGHPALLEVGTLEQAQEVAEIMSGKVLDQMSLIMPTSKFTMRWITPTRLAMFDNGEQYSHIDIGDRRVQGN